MILFIYLYSFDSWDYGLDAMRIRLCLCVIISCHYLSFGVASCVHMLWLDSWYPLWSLAFDFIYYLYCVFAIDSNRFDSH